MKKLLIGLIAVIAIGAIILFSQLDAVVETGVETAGPEMLSVDVTVGSVSISPFSGRAQITDLTVGQPDGFGDGSLVAFNEIAMKVEPATLLSDHIIIDEIVIDRPVFDARLVGSQTNFQVLQERLGSGAGESSSSGDSPVTLTIRRLSVASPQVALSSDGPVTIDEDVELESFTLTDMGTDEAGLAPKEIARHVMDFLQPQIAEAMIAAGAPDDLKKLAREARDELEKGVGGLLNKLKKKKDDGGNN